MCRHNFHNRKKHYICSTIVSIDTYINDTVPLREQCQDYMPVVGVHHS